MADVCTNSSGPGRWLRSPSLAFCLVFIPGRRPAKSSPGWLSSWLPTVSPGGTLAGDHLSTPAFEMLTAALGAGSRCSDRLIQLIKLGMYVSDKIVRRA